MKKILAVGELLWDLLPGERKLGGAPANLAYRLNSLGHPTFLMSRVGEDRDGLEALRILEEQGLDTRYIQKDRQHPTGTVSVYFDTARNPDYTIHAPVAYDYMEWNEELGQLASEADCIVYGTLVQRSAATAGTLHRLIGQAGEAVKFCDVNLRKECYNKKSVERSLQRADLAKLNHREAIELGGMFGIREKDPLLIVRKLTGLFCLQITLLTLEEMGGLAVDRHDQVLYSPGYRVPVEDPLGAGDAFSAAFLDSYLRTGNLRPSLEAANLLGAMVVAQKGAMQPVTPQEIAGFESSRPERIFMNEYRKYWDPEVRSGNEPKRTELK